MVCFYLLAIGIDTVIELLQPFELLTLYFTEAVPALTGVTTPLLASIVALLFKLLESPPIGLLVSVAVVPESNAAP